MGMQSPKKGLYLNRSSSNGRISYDLRRRWYEGRSEGIGKPGGREEKYVRRAKLSDIVDPELRSFDLRVFCEIIREKIEKLSRGKHLLEHHKKSEMSEEEWKQVFTKIHEKTPLLLANILLRFNEQEKNDILRNGLRATASDLNWGEKEAKGYRLHRDWARNLLPEELQQISFFQPPSFRELDSVVDNVPAVTSFSAPNKSADSLADQLTAAANKFLNKGWEDEATLDGKGRITIPKEVRDLWNLQKGDEIPLKKTNEGIELKLSDHGY